MVLFGLDGEMSSAEIKEGGKLIQAGAAVWKDEEGGEIEVYSSLIRQDEMQWSERASQVHGITREEVAAARPAEIVDAEMEEWLLAHGGVAGRKLLIPIGFNVASFDFPFFEQTLPRSRAIISRRAVDLNAACFTFEGWDPNPKSSQDRDFYSWKKSMKAHANARLAELGFKEGEHDAGYDAAQALVGHGWLRSQMRQQGARLEQALADLAAADPVTARLGVGLAKRLETVEKVEVEAVLNALGGGVNARKWFGTKTPLLGTSPLEALLAGRSAEVVAAAGAKQLKTPSM